jgi:glycerol-3-phosphate O-acyltransferase
MILHHFIVPFLVNLAWFNIFNGRLKNGEELRKYLLEQRDKLKYEFYLPTTKDLFIQSVELVQECTGRTIKTLDDCFMFTPAELYSVAQVVSPFSNAFRYIYECYYMTIETLLFLGNEQFDEERFFKVGREIFELERNHGRFVKHEESFTLPGVKNALMFLIHKRLVLEDKKVGTMHIPDLKLLSELKVQYAKDLTEILRLNFEFFSS